jgi:hypothetical protein
MSIVNSISQISGTDRSQAKAYLVEIGRDGKPDYGGGTGQYDKGTGNPGPSAYYSTFRAFQYYPDTITDSKSVEYATKNIIGSSHPLYQWVHGSPRTISFDAIFSSDFSTKPLDGGTELTSMNSVIESASSVVKNPVGTMVGSIKKSMGISDEMDVAAGIAWLRSKTYPMYTQKVAVAPPKLLLWLENSGITSFVDPAHEVDVVPVIMTTCDVTYESFFRNGVPRLATVRLSFSEIIQYGNSWKYVSRESVAKAWTSAYTMPASKTKLGGK